MLADALGLSERDIMRDAKKRVFQKLPIMYLGVLLLKVLRPNLRFFFIAYAYARWLDDWIDSTTIPIGEQIRLFERQENILNASYSGEKIPDLSAEEQMLVLLISADLQLWKGRLRAPIKQTFETFKFDLSRKYSSVSQDELREYSEKMGISFIRTISILSGISLDGIESNLLPMARAGCSTFILRDLFEDCSLGYLNIPNKYVSDDNKIQLNKIKDWVDREITQIEHDFNKSFQFINQLPFFEKLITLSFLLPRFRLFLKIKEMGISIHPRQLNMIDRLYVAVTIVAGCMFNSSRLIK